jgi:hypothetical protein
LQTSKTVPRPPSTILFVIVPEQIGQRFVSLAAGGDEETRGSARIAFARSWAGSASTLLIAT